MTRWVGTVGLVLACVAVALTTAPASASAPPRPGNCGTPVVATVASTSPPVPTVDNNVVQSAIQVSGLAPRLGDVDVLTNLTHSAADQIDMTLTSPQGTVVTLTTDNGDINGNVFNGTVWDDDAAPGGEATELFSPTAGHVQVHPYADNVVATPLAPEEALGAFIGENPNGTWTLRIGDDDGSGGSGLLASWSLDIQSLPATPPVVVPVNYSESPNAAIPSATTSLTTRQIQVTGEPSYLGDVDVVTDISHIASSDLQISLTSPAGTSVYLTSGIGMTPGLDDLYEGTTWDDSANPGGALPYTTNAGLAGDHPFANGVVATPLAPTEALAAFRGENPNGMWTLKVADQFGGGGGQLNSWGILVSGARCAVPDTVIDSGPADGSTVASPDASFTFSSLPAGVSTSFECSVDGGPFTACSGARDVTGLADGQHTFQVAALGDDADRDLSPATRTWTVNTTPSGGGGQSPAPGPGGPGPPPVTPPVTPPPAVTAPVLSSFAVSPRRPRAGKTLTLKWRLSKAGTVTVKIERRDSRRRFRSFGSPVRQAAPAGRGSLKLKGKVGRKRLTAGTYRATITATAPGAVRASAARTVRFTVTK